ncbi:benzaldehyde dehydrogenase (plasmid) [Rhizobium leguminosarum]|uniref:Benzaldehyde dehydrogenase n=1 Tax=Rhizobium leguminosarum TaxID=384 RepID=A0A1L3ZHW0_RHILE|nr:benzaldehyde dehydrogenase [Rhizobium leguminosarum]API55226.1 benzaldehyde dehydrogenase [Rhizobium leguminosarum]API57452.1 benzaldehyde dehydrogenase [Rhizobium leguminosarum]
MMNNQNQNFLDTERWQGRAFFADWQTTAAGVMDVTDPATGAVIVSVGVGGAADIARAATEARAAQKIWAKTLPTERARILSKAADLLEQNGTELIPWIMRESGSIYPKASIEIEHGALFIRHAASLATAPMGMMIPSMDGRANYAKRVPHGIVGVISPFNFPLVLSIRSIAAALAFGNAVVHKPDPRTPISGGIIIARIFEEAGLPKGVLQVVPGGADAGEAMCTDANIAMISFTGSARAGSKVAEIAGKHFKKIQLELGGKNSLIVLDDADLDIAASNSAWGAFLHQGQICMATGLILADEKIAEALTAKLVMKASHLPAGDPSTNQVALGPIISDSQVASIQAIVEDAVAKGAKLLIGGTHDGRFYAATVLSGVKPGMRAFDEEVFGPVACIVTFATEAEAIELTNNSDYGLAAGVISANTGRAVRIADELDVGMVHVNDQTVNGGPFAPFGGPRKSGNGTRIGGPADIEEFTTWKWISVKDAATPYPF